MIKNRKMDALRAEVEKRRAAYRRKRRVAVLLWAGAGGLAVLAGAVFAQLLSDDEPAGGELELQVGPATPDFTGRAETGAPSSPAPVPREARATDQPTTAVDQPAVDQPSAAPGRAERASLAPSAPSAAPSAEASPSAQGPTVESASSSPQRQGPAEGPGVVDWDDLPTE